MNNFTPKDAQLPDRWGGPWAMEENRELYLEMLKRFDGMTIEQMAHFMSRWMYLENNRYEHRQLSDRQYAGDMYAATRAFDAALSKKGGAQ